MPCVGLALAVSTQAQKAVSRGNWTIYTTFVTTRKYDVLCKTGKCHQFIGGRLRGLEQNHV